MQNTHTYIWCENKKYVVTIMWVEIVNMMWKHIENTYPLCEQKDMYNQTNIYSYSIR